MSRFIILKKKKIPAIPHSDSRKYHLKSFTENLLKPLKLEGLKKETKEKQLSGETN